MFVSLGRLSFWGRLGPLNNKTRRGGLVPLASRRRSLEHLSRSRRSFPGTSAGDIAKLGMCWTVTDLAASPAWFNRTCSNHGMADLQISSEWFSGSKRPSKNSPDEGQHLTKWYKTKHSARTSLVHQDAYIFKRDPKQRQSYINKQKTQPKQQTKTKINRKHPIPTVPIYNQPFAKTPSLHRPSQRRLLWKQVVQHKATVFGCPSSFYF